MPSDPIVGSFIVIARKAVQLFAYESGEFIKTFGGILRREQAVHPCLGRKVLHYLLGLGRLAGTEELQDDIQCLFGGSRGRFRGRVLRLLTLIFPGFCLTSGRVVMALVVPGLLLLFSAFLLCCGVLVGLSC